LEAALPAVLDACVLAPFGVCDLLLRLAEEPRLYSPRWTREILAEVRRTQVSKLDWPERLADYWRHQVTASFPEAMVTGHERLMGQCTNHEGDRHVLAAALKAPAHTIVTFNLGHFPVSALAPHSVGACHPQDFLRGLYDANSEAVMQRIHDIGSARGIEPTEVLRRLRTMLPQFVGHVAGELGWTM
jgi:hypothetical protein